MSYLTDGLRRAAAGETVTDREGLELAAAHAIDRLTADLARATGRDEATVSVSEGLNDGSGAHRPVSGAETWQQRPPTPDEPTTSRRA